jgi:hypothetical protein
VGATGCGAPGLRAAPGDTLRVLGAVALVCGILAPVLGVPSVIGLPLSAAVLVLSGRDLARMRRGLLDPAGEAETDGALTRREFVVHGVLRGAAAGGCPRRTF